MTFTQSFFDELEKTALFGFSKKEKQRAAHVKRHNAWANEMNQKHNLNKLNGLLAHHSKRHFKKELQHLSDSEWNAAHALAMSHPHFKAIDKKHFGDKKPGITKTAKAGELSSAINKLTSSKVNPSRYKPKTARNVAAMAIKADRRSNVFRRNTDIKSDALGYVKGLVRK